MKSRLNGWIIGFRYYFPLLLVGIVLVSLAVNNGRFLTYALGIVLLLLGFFTLTFFRDFPRKITAGENEFVSPADGKIVEIKTIDNSEIYGGKCIKIGIFMSIFNAHVNRVPFAGVVKKTLYKEGKFVNAMKPEASIENESNTIWLDTEKGTIVVKQIAGLVARRIVCNISEGEHLNTGEKFGMIKFGSRVELFLPPKIELYVRINDKVYAGTSILGKFL